MTNNSILPSLVTALLLWSVVSCSTPGVAQLASDSRLVELMPLELDARDPARKEFGRLTLLSFFQMRSRDARFGGLSGLSVGSDGKLYAISDRGHWFCARMTFDADGRLLDLLDWEIQPLLSPDGTPVRGIMTDSEALTRGPDGSFIVAFEQVHRLWHYPPPPATFHSPPKSIPVPPEVARAPANGGLEGIAVLPDGRILALTEEFQNPDGSFKGWLIEDGRFAELSYRPSDGFRVTDCAALKNGDLIVLERRYAPFAIFSARLKLVRSKNVQPGATLIGEELLGLESPLDVDNFEGVAVQEDPIKGTMIYIVSDDNFRSLQRTLLLQFRLNQIGN